MRKIVMILLPVLILVGCGTEKPTEVDVKKATEVDEVNEVETQVEVQKEEDDEVVDSETDVEDTTSPETEENNKDEETKNNYLLKLEEVEASIEELEKTVENGNQSEMNQAQNEIYQKWDAALNEVYGALEEQLSKEEMDALRVEQQKWIEDRDAAADAAAEEYKGGSLEPFAYSASLADWTKERCYELVENYMN